MKASSHFHQIFHLTFLLVGALQLQGGDSIVVPSSSCYAFDNSSHIHDFSSWVGHAFERDGQDADTVIRFCKDVERRQSTGYVDFGRYDKFNYFVAGSGQFNFVQEYYDGDLMNCEQSFDKRGRTAQVKIICGDCPNAQCKGGLGCICNVAYLSTCRLQETDLSKSVTHIDGYIFSSHLHLFRYFHQDPLSRALVELAIPCEKRGPRVFEGFTVGFHPRSWEIVYNGMTQLGFEKAYSEFSFKTEQSHLALYMTAISSRSSLVPKPTIKISPEQGLEVKLSGSSVTGAPPTTLSPSMLIVDWRCERTRDTPYEVEFIIPVEGYEPMQFTLAKMCQFKQAEGGGAAKGWAVFGVLSCIFIVIAILFCCGGFIYKSRVDNQRGLDALPGMTLLSACLEIVSGAGQGYIRPEPNGGFPNQASWERQPDSTQGTSPANVRQYGPI